MSESCSCTPLGYDPECPACGGEIQGSRVWWKLYLTAAELEALTKDPEDPEKDLLLRYPL